MAGKTASRKQSLGNNASVTKRWRNRAIMALVAFVGVVSGSTYLLSLHDIDPLQFYANMANPTMRFVKIYPGMRKEEIADVYGKVLAWNDVNRQAFLAAVPSDERGTVDGYYFPSSYWFSYDTSGAEVGKRMVDTFNEKVSTSTMKVSSRNLKNKINLDTAVRIASIIQREAAGPQDMGLVSGIMWNRIFNGMNLQMDATLQYAKGTTTDWWPDVHSKDKKIDSPYNTYLYKGLPPTAISNPSLAAIKAAYNPEKTSCIFYIHDKNHQIHCAATYEEHVRNVKQYLSN